MKFIQFEELCINVEVIKCVRIDRTKERILIDCIDDRTPTYITNYADGKKEQMESDYKYMVAALVQTNICKKEGAERCI